MYDFFDVFKIIIYFQCNVVNISLMGELFLDSELIIDVLS